MSQEPEPLPANEANKPNTRYAWVTVTTVTTSAFLCECPVSKSDDDLYEEFICDVPHMSDAHVEHEDRLEIEVDGREPSEAEIREHGPTAIQFWEYPAEERP